MNAIANASMQENGKVRFATGSNTRLPSVAAAVKDAGLIKIGAGYTLLPNA